VLDLMMPEMDGYEFSHRASGSGSGDIPTIVLSAVSNVETKAQKIPARAYLQKPVELTLLLDTVKKVIGPPEG
jgi:CheY-like chemotaxis protein